MTVEELIERLKLCDTDQIVFIETESEDKELTRVIELQDNVYLS